LPGEFIDISTVELNRHKLKIIKDNLDVFKRLARISNINHSKMYKNGVKIIVDGETFIL
jgi:hypothetical protein